jgi:hypothetical protein
MSVKEYDNDVYKLDILDLIQGRYLALDAGIVEEIDKKGLGPLTEDFRVGAAKSWFLHNAGHTLF